MTMNDTSKRLLDESQDQHKGTTAKQPRLGPTLPRPPVQPSTTNSSNQTAAAAATATNNNVNKNKTNHPLPQNNGNSVSSTNGSTVNKSNNSAPTVVIEVSSSEDESDDDTPISKSTAKNNDVKPSTNNKDQADGSFSSSSQGEISPGSEKRKKQRVRRVDGKWIFPEFTRKQTSLARRYLHKEGTYKFLEKYLPATPSAPDLLTVIVLLGFNSVKLSENLFNDDNEEQFLMYSVDLLRKAMDKVFSARTRIGSVTTVQDALDQIEKAKKILVITGAGISTSLGIPDFRSARGIYANLPELEDIDDPQQVFDLSVFRESPSIFFSVAHMILPPPDAYTALHVFIKLLSDKGKLLRNYTQNIDNLEENVGLPPDKIIQCHGSFSRATCQTCKWECKGSLIAKYILNQELPICKFCGSERRKKLQKNPDFQPQSFGVVKPNITFFGENLPARYHDNILKDAAECDLLICIGTSLKVEPVSGIVNKVSPDVPQILINKDMINHSEFDVSFLGYCDDVASYICNRLGWDINHENFNKIVQGGLDLSNVDEDMGIYKVTGHWTNDNEIDNKQKGQAKPKPDVAIENEVET